MKPEPKDNRWRSFGRSVRAEGIALTIPMVMIVCPVGGALLGRYLGEKLGIPALLIIGVIVGLAMGIWESARLLRELNRPRD